MKLRKLAPAPLSVLVLAAALIPSAMASGVAAQEGGIAASGMGQGEANINVRSDVKLAIKGTGGTSQANLELLTDAIADQMPALRACYREIIAKRPTTVGGIAARITLEQGKSPAKVEIKETAGPEPEISACVRKVFEKAPLAKVPRPSAAIATLEVSNSRAAGQAVMEERRAVTEIVDVKADPAGGFVAEWTTTDKEVSFAARSASSKEAVEVAIKNLRDRFAGFLDCRRRARKGDLSPGGKVEAQLRLARGGDASVKMGASTVAHERAPICVENALGRVKFEGAPAGQKVDVTVTFAP
jgi:hypothetical protein